MCEEQCRRPRGWPATPARTRKVGEKHVELAQRAGGKREAAPLVELLSCQPARDRVVAQTAGDTLAIRVGSPNHSIAHGPDLTAPNR